MDHSICWSGEKATGEAHTGCSQLCPRRNLHHFCSEPTNQTTKQVNFKMSPHFTITLSSWLTKEEELCLLFPKLTPLPVLSFSQLFIWPSLSPSSPGSPSPLVLPLRAQLLHDFYIHLKPYNIPIPLLCSEISFPFTFKLLKTRSICLISISLPLT